MKLINLYVDDLRECPDGFISVKSVEEAMYYINRYKIDILSLNHDLGVDARGNLLPTGYDLVKLMCKQHINVNSIYLHTENPVGRDNMYQYLINARDNGAIDPDTNIYNYPYVQGKYKAS